MVIGRGVFTLLTGLKKYSCLSCNFGANYGIDTNSSYKRRSLQRGLVTVTTSVHHFFLYFNPPLLPLSLICSENQMPLSSRTRAYSFSTPSDVLSWSYNCVLARLVCSKRTSSSCTELCFNGTQTAYGRTWLSTIMAANCLS